MAFVRGLPRGHSGRPRRLGQGSADRGLRPRPRCDAGRDHGSHAVDLRVQPPTTRPAMHCRRQSSRASSTRSRRTSSSHSTRRTSNTHARTPTASSCSAAAATWLFCAPSRRRTASRESRVGYAVADPEIIVALGKVHTPFTVSAVAQAAAIASLAAADELLARTEGVIAERTRVRTALIEAGYTVPEVVGELRLSPPRRTLSRFCRGEYRSGHSDPPVRRRGRPDDHSAIHTRTTHSSLSLTPTSRSRPRASASARDTRYITVTPGTGIRFGRRAHSGRFEAGPSEGARRMTRRMTRTCAVLATTLLATTATSLSGVANAESQDTVSVRLLAFNDLHGSLRPPEGVRSEIRQADGSLTPRRWRGVSRCLRDATSQSSHQLAAVFGR